MSAFLSIIRFLTSMQKDVGGGYGSVIEAVLRKVPYKNVTGTLYDHENVFFILNQYGPKKI